MYEVQTADLPPGHVAQVIQAGYMLGDRVLRPALVAVVKAASKSPPSSANDNPRVGQRGGIKFNVIRRRLRPKFANAFSGLSQSSSLE